MFIWSGSDEIPVGFLSPILSIESGTWFARPSTLLCVSFLALFLHLKNVSS